MLNKSNDKLNRISFSPKISCHSNVAQWSTTIQLVQFMNFVFCNKFDNDLESFLRNHSFNQSIKTEAFLQPPPCT